MAVLNSFLQSDVLMMMLTMTDLQNIRIDSKIVFWSLIVLLPIFIWPFILLEKRYRKLKKQLERDMHAPGMESARARLKSKLKEFDIKIDDRQHERN